MFRRSSPPELRIAADPLAVSRPVTSLDLIWPGAAPSRSETSPSSERQANAPLQARDTPPRRRQTYQVIRLIIVDTCLLPERGRKRSLQRGQPGARLATLGVQSQKDLWRTGKRPRKSLAANALRLPEKAGVSWRSGFKWCQFACSRNGQRESVRLGDCLRVDGGKTIVLERRYRVPALQYLAYCGITSHMA